MQRVTEKEKFFAVDAATYQNISCGNLIFEELNGYTREELVKVWKNSLSEPPCGLFMSKSVDIPWSAEEDLCILHFVRHTGENDIKSFLELFGASIHIRRSLGSILKRMNYIRENYRASMKNTIELMVENIQNEYMVHNSLSGSGEYEEECISFRCLSLTPDRVIASPAVVSEIGLLNSEIEQLSYPRFSQFDIAMLHGENYVYYMRREAISIGRSSKTVSVDIDLSVFIDCIHISKRQAIISFCPDCNFYLENTGKSILRVNGIVISPGRMCQLKNGALLDFSGILFIFLLNQKIVKFIKSSFNEASVIGIRARNR